MGVRKSVVTAHLDYEVGSHRLSDLSSPIMYQRRRRRHRHRRGAARRRGNSLFHSIRFLRERVLSARVAPNKKISINSRISSGKDTSTRRLQAENFSEARAQTNRGKPPSLSRSRNRNGLQPNASSTTYTSAHHTQLRPPQQQPQPFTESGTFGL